MLNEKRKDISLELNKESRKYLCRTYLIISDIQKQHGEILDGHIEHDQIYQKCFSCNGHNLDCNNFIPTIWYDNLKMKGYNPDKILEREDKKKTIKKLNFLERLIGTIID